MPYQKHGSRLGLVALALLVANADAQTENSFEKKWDLGASAKIRVEGSGNKDFASATDDSLDLISSQFRLSFKFFPIEELIIFMQPQFFKTWGVNEGTSATSGALFDTRLDVHQAWVSYQPVSALGLSFGRQELSYGDQLLLGRVDWNFVGRTFDAIKATWTFSLGTLDFFGSKLTETNYASGSLGDKDLFGIYGALSPEVLKNLDLYVLHVQNSTIDPIQRTTALGTRVKAKWSPIDLRAELTYELVRDSAAVSNHEFQGDIEIGFSPSDFDSVRASGEFFYASDLFDELFPSGHKWLGYADAFKRKNITGVRMGLQYTFMEHLTSTLDYHLIMRADTSSPVYKFGSAGSYGSGASTERLTAQEVDLTVRYAPFEALSFDFGGAVIFPSGYLKSSLGSSIGYFYFAQLNATY